MCSKKEAGSKTALAAAVRAAGKVSFETTCKNWMATHTTAIAPVSSAHWSGELLDYKQRKQETQTLWTTPSGKERTVVLRLADWLTGRSSCSLASLGLCGGAAITACGVARCSPVVLADELLSSTAVFGSVGTPLSRVGVPLP